MMDTGGWSSPSILLVGAATLLFAGALTLGRGRRSAKWGVWLAAAAAFGFFGVLIYQWSLLAQTGFAPLAWSRGWILPKDEALAIRIGILRDPLGILLSVTAVACGGLMLALVPTFLRAGGEDRGREDRLVAAVAISTASVAIAWLAETPWLALIGCVGATGGGFLAFSAKEGDENEAQAAGRFVWERAAGVLMVLLGLGVLALQSRADGGPVTRAFGEGLVFLGLVAQLHLFPLTGGLTRPAGASLFFTTALGQVFPAWAAAAILIRFLPQFSGTPALVGLAWFGLFAAVVSALIGLFAGASRAGLGAWIAAGFALATAITAQAGARAGLGAWLSVGLGALGFAAVSESPPVAGTAKAGWARAGLLLSAGALMGAFGFTGAGSWLAGLLSAWDTDSGFPVWGAAFAVSLAGFVFLGATLLIRAWSGPAPRGWPAALLPLMPALLALGIAWDGTLSGGALPGLGERVSLSLLDLAIKPPTGAGDGNLPASEGMLWGAFALALALGLWRGRRAAGLDALPTRFPRFAGWIRRGLGADSAGRGLVAASAWLGRGVTRWGDDAFWNGILPAALDRATRGLSGAIGAADARLAWWIGSALRPGLEWPARALQWIQSGDVQWYIGVALASLLAVIAAFISGP